MSKDDLRMRVIALEERVAELEADKRRASIGYPEHTNHRQGTNTMRHDTEHKVPSEADRSLAAVWFCGHRMRVEFLQRDNSESCSEVYDSPCEASDPPVVYRHKRFPESWLVEHLNDVRYRFCLCGRTEWARGE